MPGVLRHLQHSGSMSYTVTHRRQGSERPWPIAEEFTYPLPLAGGGSEGDSFSQPHLGQHQHVRSEFLLFFLHLAFPKRLPINSLPWLFEAGDRPFFYSEVMAFGRC